MKSRRVFNTDDTVKTQSTPFFTIHSTPVNTQREKPRSAPRAGPANILISREVGVFLRQSSDKRFPLSL